MKMTGPAFDYKQSAWGAAEKEEEVAAAAAAAALLNSTQALPALPQTDDAAAAADDAAAEAQIDAALASTLAMLNSDQPGGAGFLAGDPHGFNPSSGAAAGLGGGGGGAAGMAFGVTANTMELKRATSLESKKDALGASGSEAGALATANAAVYNQSSGPEFRLPKHRYVL